jgi:hypothetical protein
MSLHTTPTSLSLQNWCKASTTVLLLVAASVIALDTDQFSYRDTVTGSPNNVYGPKDWGKVKCSEVDTCVSNTEEPP